MIIHLYELLSRFTKKKIQLHSSFNCLTFINLLRRLLPKLHRDEIIKKKNYRVPQKYSIYINKNPERQ